MIDKRYKSLFWLSCLENPRLEEVSTESKTPNRRTGCNVKNGECVPKCSELTPEQQNKGLQCEVGKILFYPTLLTSKVYAIFLFQSLWCNKS